MKFKPFLLSVLAFALIFSHAGSQPGFISIDCGLPLESTNYNDTESGIIYSTDQNSYIDTGVNSSIDPKLIENSPHRHLHTVRYFPQEQQQGNRSCYNLISLRAANKRYLIRATFKYGNYDGRNQPPRFHLYLGVEFWDTVEINDTTSVLTKEIIHVPLSNYLYVCLVDTGAGIPFISALELRLLKGDAYKTQDTGESLVSFHRWNFAPADPTGVTRYPDDKYDRLWQPYDSPDDWIPLNTTLSVAADDDYAPPETVVQTAVTPRNPNGSLRFSWKPPDPKSVFYVYFYFAEFASLPSNEYRGMYIYLNDIRWRNDAVLLTYLSVNTVSSSRGNARSIFNFSLVETANSTLPPIINAFEAYKVKQLLQSQTDENDVVAILCIKNAYGVKRDWQGDPCLPENFTWDGLDCIISGGDNSIPPRIKSLNMSSFGLNGTVSSYFSKLTILEILDLSNNNLSGFIPDFLAAMPKLKILNLSGNNFTGPIPQKLLNKAKSGLQLRADESESGTPDKREAGECRSGNKSNNLVILMAVCLAVSISVVLASLIYVWRFRRIKSKAKVVKLGSISKSNRRKAFMETKKKKFTYSDIYQMTNNFQRIIGKGGFGTVYHGTTADGKEVAVKLLSQASTQGYNEFQTEAELLTRVHHCKLTIMVGYCYEDSHMALVYEYMAGGNLREHLSGNGDVLSWSERLHILLDAAQGLDYLHNGCKPPIIHRDIKCTNILLNENLEAKLADFGLSRAFTIDDGSYVSTRVVGTPGYLDPEYYETQRLHEKSDIYSFGVVILELITCRPVISGNGKNRRHIVHWVGYLLNSGDVSSIVDPKLEGVYDVNTVWKALETAMSCTSPTSLERPDTAHVLAELKECLEVEKTHSEGQETDDASYKLLEADPGILEIEIGAR